MDTAAIMPFAALLRRYRLAAGLSQEELAERAALSVEAVGALERGVRRAPYSVTVELLAEALALTPEQREQFLASVPRRRHRIPLVPQPVPKKTNLQAPFTSFIGREQAQATVLRLLESSRLLTLTGTGGVGKTRLATQVAAGLGDGYPDGIFLVELAPLADAALVPQAVAQTLGVRKEQGRPLTETLVAAVTARTLLLVLDNCEHLRPAAADLAERLLRAGPHLRILATSREALGVVGETVWWVPSLAVPVPAPAAEGPPRHSTRSVARAEAAQFFIERATAAHPAFALTDANAPAVATVCVRLDGIPLALELAAARARIFTPEQIAARLDARFRLLTGGSPDAQPRQQTLRAALDWSYDLLREPERRLLARLSVFPGGCEIEAAEAVCIGGEVAVEALFDLITNLVEKSLVTVEYRGTVARYRLLETIRQYAGDRLDELGESDATRRLQGAWALELVERAGTELHGPAQASWLDRLDAEHDNLRAVLQWTLDRDAIEQGLRLTGSMGEFWRARGHLSEAAQWLERLLARGTAASAAVRATALHVAARIASLRGNGQQARHYAEGSLTLSRECGDERLAAATMHHLGVVAVDDGDRATAVRFFEESLALARALDDPALIRPPLYNLAILDQREGRPALAEERLQEALALARRAGDIGGMASILTALGFGARHGGQPHRAREHYEEALRLRRELGDRLGIANTVRLLADLETAVDDLAGARAHAEEALAIAREIGHAWGVISAYDVLTFVARRQGDLSAAREYARAALRAAWSLGERKRIHGALWEYAAVAAAAGQDQRAVRVFAASEELRQSLGFTLGMDHVEAMTEAMATVRARLGEAAYAAAFTEGAALSPEQAVAAALADEDEQTTAARRAVV